MTQNKLLVLESDLSSEILDRLSVGLLLFRNETILYVNQFFAEIIHYRIDEVVNTDISLYFHPKDVEELYSFRTDIDSPLLKHSIRIKTKIGEIIPLHFQLNQLISTKKNTYLLVVWSTTPTLNQKTFPKVSLDHVVEIDQLKSQSIQLIHEKQQIEVILNNISDGVIVLDQDGKTLNVNYAARRIIRKILSLEVTENFNFILSTGNIFFDTIRKLFLSNDLYQKEIIEVIPGVFIEFTVALNSSTNQNALVTIVEFKDITEFVTFDNLRKKFVSVVSHELRTPISAINLALINLQRYGSKLTEDQKKALINSMGRSAEVLNQQVDDLLILSRFDAGKTLNLKLEEYHLLGTIYSVLAQLEPRTSDKNLEINVTGSSDIVLLGDIHRIEQIIRIITDNAIKYSKNNSKISIRIIENYQGDLNTNFDNGALVQVQDQGIGISPDDLPYIFQRFYRSDDVINIQGTGIGLALAKELVHLHQGSIDVESQYRKGSTFNIFLPLLERKSESNTTD